MKRRAFLLATMLCLIPIALVITFALSATLVQQSGMTVLAIRKNKAFYLGQAGLATAYHVFGLNNHAGHTHEPDGITQTSTGDRQFLETFATPGLSLDGGWYRWQWSSGDPVAASFTRSGSFESYRFKVYLPTPQTWRIECQATADGVISQQAVGGSIQGIYDYMVFDNGDSNDFSRAEQHRVTGKIHANGNLFLRPWTTNGFTIAGVEIIAPQEPANLDIDATQVSSAKRIVRFQDHQGNPDPGGNLRIGSSDLGVTPVVMEGLSQGAAGQGNAYDSYHPDWRSSAIAKFQGIVTDSELGAKKLAIPQRGALEPGGYYDQRAGLRIDSTTTTAWCSDATFYNQNEARQVTVKEIDVAQMVSANQLPANGVIYSQVPIRLVNAHFVPQKLTIAAQGTIYTKGDFNKDNPDGTGPGQSQPAALLTTDRIYNLTSSFDDARSSQYFDPLNIADPPPLASDPPLFPGDDDNTLEINAALTDGAPTRDERAWIEGNPFHTTAQVPNLETGEPTGVLIVPDAHDPGSPGLKVTYPNSSDMLENLQQVRLRYRGSMSHMRNARMARFDHSDLASDPGLTPWIVKTSYLPPQDRSFEQDPRLNSLENGPPLQPRASRKLYWQEIR